MPRQSVLGLHRDPRLAERRPESLGQHRRRDVVVVPVEADVAEAVLAHQVGQLEGVVELGEDLVVGRRRCVPRRAWAACPSARRGSRSARTTSLTSSDWSFEQLVLDELHRQPVEGVQAQHRVAELQEHRPAGADERAHVVDDRALVAHVREDAEGHDAVVRAGGDRLLEGARGPGCRPSVSTLGSKPFASNWAFATPEHPLGEVAAADAEPELGHRRERRAVADRRARRCS